MALDTALKRLKVSTHDSGGDSDGDDHLAYLDAAFVLENDAVGNSGDSRGAGELLQGQNGGILKEHIPLANSGTSSGSSVDRKAVLDVQGDGGRGGGGGLTQGVRYVDFGGGGGGASDGRFGRGSDGQGADDFSRGGAIRRGVHAGDVFGGGRGDCGDRGVGGGHSGGSSFVNEVASGNADLSVRECRVLGARGAGGSNVRNEDDRRSGGNGLFRARAITGEHIGDGCSICTHGAGSLSAEDENDARSGGSDRIGVGDGGWPDVRRAGSEDSQGVNYSGSDGVEYVVSGLGHDGAHPDRMFALGASADRSSDDQGALSGSEDMDIRSIAAYALREVQLRRRDELCDVGDDVSGDGADDTEDLLRYLDAAFKIENTTWKTGRELSVGEIPGRIRGGHRNDVMCGRYSGDAVTREATGNDTEMNIGAVAKFAMGAVKWKHVLEGLAQAPKPPDDDMNTLIQSESYNQNLDVLRDRHSASQREYRRRVKSYSTESVLKSISDDERAVALRRLQEALGPEGLDECVCAACDELVLRCQSTRVDAADWRYMAKMRRSLGEVDAALPRQLVEEYCAPACVAYLVNVMVSPRSFRCYTDENGHSTAWFTVCKACNRSIERGYLPKFAISNGFYIGSLPDSLRSLTLPERFMTQLSSLADTTRVMCGGRHRCIRSHCIAFDCTPSPPMLLLPRSASELTAFRVAMVGDFTDAQTQKVKKMHEIRGENVRDVLTFYRLNNVLYASVSADDDALNKLTEAERIDLLSIDHIEDERGDAEDGVNEEQENIRGHSDAWRVATELDELSVVERRIGLSDASRVLLSREHELVIERNRSASNGREFLVKHSNHLSTDVSGDLLAKLFPHLFPFGRGHPGELRQTPVSLRECVKHYTLLSGRRFAEDELFTLTAFDRISMKNMYTQNALWCQRFPAIYSGYEKNRADDLGKALLENEQRRQGQRARSKDPGSVAHKFLKTVEIASAAVWGSNAERAKCRQKAFAYQTRFGQPTLFITLTPNTDNSLVMWHYAGKTSVNSLFDILEACTATKAELREASLGNDCTSARLFMRNVDAFIKHVLGMDPLTNAQMSFKGLIGEVEAYFGMVETQGRGTLHIHFLIWLKDAPSSSVELEQKLSGADGATFQSSVESYVNSIVSNDLPLSVERHSCVKCGASYSHLVGLDIPARARQNVRRGIYSTRAHSSVVEPVLVQCGVCLAKFSSQHVLRNILLQSRPLHWPMWERNLTASEIADVAKRESICRSSLNQTIDIVNEREKIQMALRSECRDLSDTCGLVATPETELLYQANSPQMVVCKSDDDPFQNDNLTRIIEVSPPLLSDNRMGSEWMNYMVSVLVVLLNQHWWCHTGSCFKVSKSTVNDSYCRYLFPWERKARTTFELTGVCLKRKMCHEFINGFNFEIMAAFKCNHDIQFLLGGKDAADRIYYCTKYVTKQQKRLDSVVVMALAAFRRRQEREQTDACIDLSSSLDYIATARKRVAYMVYTMTNRQEIAGPLAALYLYRGSCCYESSKCSFVPVCDIINQLCSTEEYSCRLVNESDDSGSSKYVAVSFLDDYIYRPDSLVGTSIYEFAMKYFRKKKRELASSQVSI